MEVDLFVFISDLFESLQAFLDDSLLFTFIKFFLFVYTAVLVIDIVLLFWFRDVRGDFAETLFGAKRPLMRRSAAIKRWEGILARLEGDNESQYKAALLEADAFTEELLKGMGYKGANMKERLEKVQEYQLATKSELEAAHRDRNRVINEPDFRLSKEEAEANIERYKAFFREIELFS